MTTKPSYPGTTEIVPGVFIDFSNEAAVYIADANSVDEKKVWEDELKALQLEGKKTFMGIHVTAIARLTVSVAVE